jgi:outer membrane lipopolysaccharide assembly protein LptE/RlpB
MKKIIILSVSIFLISLVASCGYKFSGGGLLPGKTKFVAVEMFENKSSETGAEIIFANALSVELMEKSDSQVVDFEKADAVFIGLVKSVSISTLTRTSADTVIERKVSAVIDLKMVDKEGQVLWFVKDFQGREEFRVTTVNITDMASRTEALQEIAERIAQKVVSRMLDDF